mmetsp:Transcript_15250/g.22722  ORF Transcript_15250/g.22722 Transcript_15250/m.22722 type:complete len:258 (-) Transcript_15250:240-1013(-)
MMLSSALPRTALVRALNSTSFRPAAKEALHRSRAYNITTKAISSSRCLCTLTSPSHTMIKHEHKRYNSPDIQLVQKRSNFSFAGPRKLSDILKVELLKDKSNTEISDMWMTYHEGKEKVHGIVMDGKKGRNLLSKAAQCPFFIQPVFRGEGHFMVVSQFQTPNYFLLALLEDYKMDPAAAQPILTVSVFDDLAETKDVVLLRCDIINRGIEDDEGYKLCQNLINDYLEFEGVHMFNKNPDAFDVDEFVKEKEQKWNE